MKGITNNKMSHLRHYHLLQKMKSVNHVLRDDEKQRNEPITDLEKKKKFTSEMSQSGT